MPASTSAPHTRLRRLSALCAALFAGAGLSAPLAAADYVWLGQADTLWNTNNRTVGGTTYWNWSPSGPPTNYPASRVFIDNDPSRNSTVQIAPPYAITPSPYCTQRIDCAAFGGSVQRVNGEVSVPPGDLRYMKASYQHQTYFPLWGDFVLMLNGELGYGRGYGGKPLPFYKNYYVGGIGSVRGFETASIGQRDRDANGNLLRTTIGGDRKLVMNAEVLFPFPGMGQDKTLRLGTFFDAGNVWADGQSLSVSDLRYSAGLSVAWSSPMGPLKFSIAQPLNKEPTDRLQRFQFQMGNVF